MEELAELFPCHCYYADGKRKNPLPAGNHDEDCLTKFHPTITAWVRKREAELEIELERIRTLLHAVEVDAKCWQDNAWAARNKQVEAERNLATLRQRLAALEAEARCNDYWANFQY